MELRHPPEDVAGSGQEARWLLSFFSSWFPGLSFLLLSTQFLFLQTFILLCLWAKDEHLGPPFSQKILMAQPNQWSCCTRVG